MGKPMRRAAALAIAALTFGGFVSPLPASAEPSETSGSWFVKDASRTGKVAPSSEPDAHRLRLVEFDPDSALESIVTPQSLALAQSGDRITVPAQTDLSLTLFDGQVLPIEITQVAVSLDVESNGDAPNVEVLGHHVVGGAVMATAAFTFVVNEFGRYEFRGDLDRGPDRRVAIQQSSPTVVELAEKSTSGADVIDSVESGWAPADEAIDRAPTPRPEVSAAADSVPIVDVLVGYVSSLGYRIDGIARQKIAQTNAALLESGARIQLRVIAVTPIAYVQDANTLTTDLANLFGGKRGLGPLMKQREAIGADLVALIVPETRAGKCGQGIIPRDPVVGDASMPISVTASTCLGDQSFAHEVGHTLGADHDLDHSSKADRPFEFSYGHQVPGVARTIMSYSCPSGDCPARMQYSNPQVPFIGSPSVPSGTAKADAARTFSLMAPVVGAYRDRTPVARLAGADRFTTAVSISKHGYPDPSKVDTVLVATGLEFPDALSAAPLAAKLGAPLLLTMPGELPAATSAEIARLKPSKVIVVGGPNVVADSVLTGLKKTVPASGSVQRLWGADRYETSLAVVRHGWTTTESAFLATGIGFADALSAGAAAGVRDAPVLLVPGGWDTVYAPAADYLSTAKVKDIYIAGATGVISPGIEDNLKAKKYIVTRYGGSDRFSTSTLIAKAHHRVGGRLYMATAHNFPDALAGAAVAGANKAPLILSVPGCVLTDIQDVQLTIKPSLVVLLGGVAGLSEEVAQGQPCT